MEKEVFRINEETNKIDIVEEDRIKDWRRYWSGEPISKENLLRAKEITISFESITIHLTKKCISLEKEVTRYFIAFISSSIFFLGLFTYTFLR